MVNTQEWIKRADELVATIGFDKCVEGEQFTTSMITAFYRPNSPQMRTFREAVKTDYGNPVAMCNLLVGTLRNIMAEVQLGLVKNVRPLLTGEIVAEILALAKETFADQSEAAKNVTAVLVAAAFEDIIRRMGAEFAGVTARPKSEDAITSLKQSSVLKGGEVTTALGYLKFRNDSLHADWIKVERSQVASCLAFVEALLVKHFS